MNILFLTTHLNTGGITSYLFVLAKELVRLGHRVFVISSGGDCVEQFTSIGIACRQLNIRTKSEASWKIYAALPKIVKLVRAERITVIHANTRVTQVLGWCLGRLTGIPLMTTCHGFFKPRWLRRIFPAWGRAVVAISPAVKEHLVRDFQLPADKVFLVRSGISIDAFPLATVDKKKLLRQQHQLTEGPVVGIIARLSDVKGHAVLIVAMSLLVAKFPAVRLVIVGQGKMEKELRRQVADLGLEQQVVFLPIVNRTADILPLFDVFVLPSLQEGLGLSVMEAQAAGLPVVATRVGGLPSLIEDGVTGRLVAPNNPHQLAEAISDVLWDSQRATAMGLAARAFIAKEFSAARMAEETVAVYQRIGEGL